MKTIHPINENTRILKTSTRTKQIGAIQTLTGNSWVTEVRREYPLDIRVDPVPEMERLGKQLGLIQL